MGIYGARAEGTVVPIKQQTHRNELIKSEKWNSYFMINICTFFIIFYSTVTLTPWNSTSSAISLWFRWLFLCFKYLFVWFYFFLSKTTNRFGALLDKIPFSISIPLFLHGSISLSLQSADFHLICFVDLKQPCQHSGTIILLPGRSNYWIKSLLWDFYDDKLNLNTMFSRHS